MSRLSAPAALSAMLLVAGTALCTPANAQYDDPRILVFVTAPTRDGFLDTSKDMQDSIRDIAKEISSKKELRLVDTREQADIVLTVAGRGVGSQAFGQRVQYNESYRNAELTSTPILANTFWVTAVLEIGAYRKEFTGAQTQESEYSLGAWTQCADRLVKDLRAWASANGEQVRQRRTKKQQG
jgi:hypothetical protein